MVVTMGERDPIASILVAMLLGIAVEHPTARAYLSPNPQVILLQPLHDYKHPCWRD